MKKLLIFQYGDVRTAMRNFNAGGTETYYDQRRAVAYLQERAGDGLTISVAYPVAEDAYEDEVTPGLHCIGVPVRHFYDSDLGPELIARSGAEAAIVAAPHVKMLRAVRTAGLPVFANFADVFRPVRPWELSRSEGLRRMRDNIALRRLLRAPNVTAVGNHSLGASRSLHKVLGVPKERITPWEWTSFEVTPRHQPFCEGGLSIVYAGGISEAKGVGDLLRAVAGLHDRGLRIRLVLFGEGPDRLPLEEETERLGLTSFTRFAGLRPNAEVRAAMAEADAVAVPSRPVYAEALPNVISEALSVSTPVVITDHPAFAFRFTHDEDALIARSGDPGSLGRTLGRLYHEPGLARRLSDAAPRVLSGLRFGTLWYDLMDNFLGDPRGESGWVDRHSFARMEAARG
ncbi:glycosyltransferase family 4 protein [Pseudoroseicyclus tamaricis]|uniref:Glycosyltransferase n=1 Tax=Pseudoroseicyclus tamaricis TaxID=2705421 RepID=A0A6B2JM64_9RHOB|nr:glycosyltransferase [Pseudoroseicyclus tamaricis]NDU99726.1 glycosyltransferase [Pseudoroseicyclus tamaricis]